MPCHSWQRRLPVILLACVLLGSAQAADDDGKLTQSKEDTRFDVNSLPENPFIPEAPTDLVVDVSCQNQGFITWKYQSNADGFLFRLCQEGDVACTGEIIRASARKHELKLQKPDARYNVHLWAYWYLWIVPLYSDPASTRFSSYPKVPDVKSLTVTPLNSTAIQATWKEKWAHEIKFLVCQTSEECQEHQIPGKLKTFTFNGLAPDTAYAISAQAHVTLNNKTCQGVPESRTAQTFETAPGPVSNLKYKVVNRVFINASWDAPNDFDPVEGYTIECRDIDGAYDVAGDVFGPKYSLDVIVSLRKFATTFNCSVLAFINSTHHGRVNGTKTVFEVSTDRLEPPVDLNVMVQCNNQANITWDYDLEFGFTGFLANLCLVNGSFCNNRTLSPITRTVSYELLEYDALYNISLLAYVDDTLQAVLSQPTTAKFFSFPKPPGSVSNLRYEVGNRVFLNASWYPPNDTDHVDGYTIECRDIEGTYDVAEDVLLPNYSGDVIVALRKFATTFNCSVLAFINSTHHGRVNGSKTVFEVSTAHLGPPMDLNVMVQCKNKANISWDYDLDFGFTGFLANLCSVNGSFCKNRTLSPTTRRLSYELQEYDALYNVSLSAYVDNSLQTIVSQTTMAKFFSFPKLPEVKSLTLTPLNYSAIKATWKEEWAHKITFRICRIAKECTEHVVMGTLHKHFFKGLVPDSAYTVSAEAEVTVNNETCRGAPQSRTTETFPKPPGPVLNVNYEIVNDVILNAAWDAPNGTKPVDGYTIDCRDIEGVYEVSQDVLATKPSENVTVPLRKFASTFSCSVWAFIGSSHHYRVNGTKTVFEISTHKLERPAYLSVIVQCGNKANVTWNYAYEVNITGFVMVLCRMNESHCTNMTLPSHVTYMSFGLQEYNALYNISLMAYVDDGIQRIHSGPTTAKFFSFPKLPVLDVSVTALSSSALRAVWKKEWDHEIEFHVCTTPYNCQSYAIPGTLQEYTFSGLHPDTLYSLSAQAEVTLNNRTCKGTQQNRNACTFAEAPGIITELKHRINNGIILVASWNSPKEAKLVKGHTITCIDTTTKKNVTTNVDVLEPSLQVSVNLHEPVALFHCSVWAYNKNKAGQRAPGPNTTFEVTTCGIVPPRNVTLVERTATSLTYTWIADPTARRWNITPVGEELLTHTETVEHGESDDRTVTHNITNLIPWRTYNISVENCRPSFCSEPIFVLSTTDVAAPSEVRDLKYTIVQDVQVRLKWKHPEHTNGPIDGYSVAVFNEDQKEGTIYDVKGSVNETTIDLKYEFNIFNISVKAYNVDKDRNKTIGGSSSEVELETLGEGPMPPRSKLGTIAEDTVYISWEMPEDPRFNITDFNVSVSHKKSVITRKQNFTITNLEPWTEYNVSVSSCTNATVCGQEFDRHFKTDVGEPSQPLQLKVSFTSTNWILVEWKQPKVHNGPLSGYNVTSKGADGEVQAATTQLWYNITGLVVGTAYNVSVYAFNDGLTTTKRGPETTIKAATESDKPSGTVTLLAILIPLALLLALVAGVLIWRGRQARTGDQQPLTTAE